MCLRWVSPVRINVSARITGIKYVGEMLTIMGTGGVDLNLANYGRDLEELKELLVDKFLNNLVMQLH